jgi:hypothetical protein
VDKSDKEVGWKTSEGSYAEQASHYVKTLASFLPSSLRPDLMSGPVEVHESTFVRAVLNEGGPLRLLLSLTYANNGAAIFDVRSSGVRLLLFAPAASRLLPLWAPFSSSSSSSPSDALERERPCFVAQEGDALLSVRGSDGVGKPLMQLRAKHPIDAFVSCPRGLVVLAGGRATLYSGGNLSFSFY